MSFGICGVILAAGQSSRMGRDKALLPWPKADPGTSGSLPAEGTLLSCAIHSLDDHCDQVIVVAGANTENLRPIVDGCGAALVSNPDPERGQFSSLQTGLQEVLNRGRDSAIVTLVDRPPVREETLVALLDAFLSRPHGAWAVVPEHEGSHGHPVVIAREMLEAFLKAPASSSAREIMHANPSHIVYVPLEDSLVTTNVDTPQDYASIES